MKHGATLLPQIQATKAPPKSTPWFFYSCYNIIFHWLYGKSIAFLYIEIYGLPIIWIQAIQYDVENFFSNPNKFEFVICGR